MINKKEKLSKELSIEVIDKEIRKINKMSHEEMCRLWRYAPSDHPYFNIKLPYHRIFQQRLFGCFGGFTPKISKSIDK